MLREARAAAEKLGGNVYVAGNSDKAGNAAYNKTLSELRADTVAKYRSATILASRLRTAALGELSPLLPTVDGTAKRANRRVEIVVNPKTPEPVQKKASAAVPRENGTPTLLRRDGGPLR